MEGTDVRLMTRSKAVGRELARHIRSDLVHLGLVDADGPHVTIAAGQQASRSDMLRVTRNDYRAGVANKDLLLIESVNDDGSITVRREAKRDPDTGQRRWSDDTFRWHRYHKAESGYWSTGHGVQGSTVTVGITFLTGSENAQWIYPALTRGTEENHACVITTPTISDPRPGGQADPEIARHERIMAERSAEPAPASSLQAGDQPEPRDPLAR